MEYLELGDKSGHLLPGEEPLREQEALDPIIPKTGEGEGADQGDFGGTNTTPEGTQTGNQKKNGTSALVGENTIAVRLRV